MVSYQRSTFIQKQKENAYWFESWSLTDNKVIRWGFLKETFLRSLCHTPEHLTNQKYTKKEMCISELQAYLPVLKCIEGWVKGHIIPLTACYVIGIVYNSKCIDQMSTQVWVHILRKVLSSSCSVLRPVCEVTHQSWTGYWAKREWRYIQTCQQ